MTLAGGLAVSTAFLRPKLVGVPARRPIYSMLKALPGYTREGFRLWGLRLDGAGGLPAVNGNHGQYL